MSDGITLKGEFQGEPGRVLRWFFGFPERLTRVDRWLVAYTAFLSGLLVLFLSAIHGFAGNPRGQLHWERAGP